MNQNDASDRYSSDSEKDTFNLKRSFLNVFQSCRESNKLVLLVVFIALFFDNMLLTTVVPIIPEYLFELDHPNQAAEFNAILKHNNLSFLTSTKSSISLEDYSFPRSLTNISKKFTDDLNAIKLEKAKEKWRTVQMNKLNTKVGLMFASKPIIQLITNPFIGSLTNRIGYSIPMFAGFVIMFISSIIFAFSQSYALLFLARAVQGIGSACSSVAGLGMLADRYHNDVERGNAMGIALGGLALGVLVGPPFGGVIYEFFGKEVPFLILASLGLIDGVLQLLILKPSVKKEKIEEASLKALIKDPYIIIAAGSITLGNMGIAMMEQSLPIWMINTMHSENWQLGAAFLPASIAYLIGTNLFGRIAYKMGRWLCCMIGLIIIGIALFCVPLASNIYGLILPNFFLGFSIGMVDSSMMPIMGYLVDIRHASIYGSVYAIADVAFCLGFALGPALSGLLVTVVGFQIMLSIIAIVCIAYAPLTYFLKNPPAKEENIGLLDDCDASIKYVTNSDQSNEVNQGNYS